MSSGRKVQCTGLISSKNFFDDFPDDLMCFLIMTLYKNLLRDVPRNCAEEVAHAWSRQHKAELCRIAFVQTCRRLVSLFRSLLQSDIVQGVPALLYATIETFISRLVDKTQAYCMDRPYNEKMYYWLVIDGLGGLGLIVRRWNVVPRLTTENLHLTFVWSTHDNRIAKHRFIIRAPKGFEKEPAKRTAAQATELRVWVEEEILTIVRGGASMFSHLQRQELVEYDQRGLRGFM
jgi:hypothetical protein